MLSSQGFDLWADGYDKSVGLSDEEGSYPFAGYKDILNEIYNRVLCRSGRDVLDIGFGTGTLTCKLYARGCHICGQDFSRRMVELAQEKMPDAELYQGDFSLGLATDLKKRTYDAIIATYSLHHLSDAQKIAFIRELLPLLNEDGCIYIGDVAFATRDALEACMVMAGDAWDDEEIYFVYDELKPYFPNMTFTGFSDCAGLLVINKNGCETEALQHCGGR